MRISVEVDPHEILSELDSDTIFGYLINTGAYPKKRVEEFYHGDFDLKAFLKEIRKEDALRICLDFIKEEAMKT